MTTDVSASEMASLPVIDIGPLLRDGADANGVAEQIRVACHDCGFFYVVGHGVDEDLGGSLEAMSREFFALPLAEKMKIPMRSGGRAWRGYFSVGDELTSGRPDQKEGLYFGAELPADHPDVLANLPFHGPNLFPAITGFRETVLDYIAAMTQLGHALMRGFSLGLGLEADYFARHYTQDPLVLFRVFNYPRRDGHDDPNESWGVGEHTDYGILTILRQDTVGGLQVRSEGRWIDAPPIPGSFVCNIGDMLERMTAGLFRSTPHRVLNTGNRSRLSFPFFFDPNFHAQVSPINPSATISPDARQRWDAANVHDWQGTYGDYLLSKVAKVFPELERDTMG
jgi:isopenicillin N synthase-like dioxygenase